MLTENQINHLPERIYERLNKVNSDCITSISNVIKEIGELRPKDVHQLQQMYNYGADIDKVVKELARANEKNVSEIYEMFDIVAKDNYNYAKPFYKAKGIEYISYEENENLKEYVKSIAKQTADEYINLTQHTAFAIFSQDGKSIAPLFEKNKNKIATSISDTYTRVIDYAVTKVQLGTESYQSATREVVKAMVNSGIKTVDYATGYKRRLDSAVRQNILWGLKECNQNSADMIGEEFGADGYEISYHSNPRPSHADMGGKRYARGPARTVKGVYYPSFEEEAEPLLKEFGCLHFKYSILLGISPPAIKPEQLAEFKANDNKTFEFEGKKTVYEGKQIMNKLESSAKNYKDLANAAKASGDDVLRREVQEKINLITSKYYKISQASGLPTRAERMQVAGFRKLKEDENLTFIKNQSIIKGQSTLPAKLYLPNEKLADTSNVNFPKMQSVVPKKALLENVVVIAGDGTNQVLRDVKRLYTMYPNAGKAENWQKKVGTVKTERFSYEIHWYSNGTFVPSEDIKTVRVKKI